MKTRKKVLRCIITLIVIAWIVSALLFVSHKNKVKEYSTYCMDAVRAQLWEYIWNIYINDSIDSEWVYVYTWGITYEWVDYSYSCKVYNKENVDLKLDPINQPEIEPVEPEEIESNEPEINEPEELVIEEDLAPEDTDMPVAKMRVIEWETEEETQALVEETCVNLWGEWDEWTCVLEDWSELYF